MCRNDQRTKWITEVHKCCFEALPLVTPRLPWVSDSLEKESEHPRLGQVLSSESLSQRRGCQRPHRTEIAAATHLTISVGLGKQHFQGKGNRYQGNHLEGAHHSHQLAKTRLTSGHRLEFSLFFFFSLKNAWYEAYVLNRLMEKL